MRPVENKKPLHQYLNRKQTFRQSESSHSKYQSSCRITGVFFLCNARDYLKSAMLRVDLMVEIEGVAECYKTRGPSVEFV